MITDESFIAALEKGILNQAESTVISIVAENLIADLNKNILLNQEENKENAELRSKPCELTI